MIKGLEAEIRTKVFLATMAFVSGFSFVVIFLGASATYIGSFIGRYSDIIRVAGGIVIIIFGLLFAFIKKAAKAIRYINALAGILLIFMGILLITNKLYLLYTQV